MDFSSIGGIPDTGPAKAGGIDFSSIGGIRDMSEASARATPGIFAHLMRTAEQEWPAIGGGMVGGAALGVTGGPVGAVLGAGLGGAAGKAGQILAQYRTGTRSPLADTSLGNAAEIGKSGAAQAAGELTGQVAGPLVKALTPAAVKEAASAIGNRAAELGGQALKIPTSIPEKYGTAFFKDMKGVTQALPQEAVSKGYQDFEAKAGVKGLDQLVQEREKEFSAADLSAMVRSTANKVRATAQKGFTGTPPTAQELYQASQAENQLARLAKYGNPDAAAMLGSNSLKESGKTVDAAMDALHPEYGTLRKAQFMTKAKEAISSVLPQNKNLSPNILRPTAAATAALTGLAAGHPGALLGLPLVSPLATTGAIRAATALAGVVPGAAMKTGAQAAVGEPSDAQIVSGILRMNVLNPDKSGPYGKAVTGLGLPGSLVSKSGKASLSDVAQKLYDSGRITENDEGAALDFIKRTAGSIPKR